MNKQTMHQCPGCKAIFPIQDELAHYQFAGIGKYGIAAPECLAAYFDVLAKENELFGYPPAHRLMVDAYSVQHPRVVEYQKSLNIEPRLVRASIQSIVMHLLALYLAIEKKVPLLQIASEMDKILTGMNAQGVEFEELISPDDLGHIKAVDVKKLFFSKPYTLDEYTQLAWDWAHTTWNAWAKHHDKVRTWYKKYAS